MPYENEDLMHMLQRAAVLSRRSRRAHVKRRADEQGGESCCKASKDGHRGSRNAMAFDELDATHGYGNHKCHGGSGRHGQNRVLATLVLSDGLSQKDLAYLLGIRPQSLGEALDKLESSELIVRRQNEEDKRVMNVFLTEAGRVRAAKVAEDRKKSANDVFGILTDEEKEQYASIMTKIIAQLDADLSEKSSSKKDMDEDAE